MKKLILFLLLSASLLAESRLFMGVKVGVFNEIFDTIEAYNSSSITTLKIGYGDLESYAIEFSLDYSPNNSKIFSSSNDIAHDGDKYGFSVSLLKSFNLDIYILPFIRIGFGTGFLDIDRELQQSLTYGSFQGALGTFIPVNDDFDLELGYEVRGSSYQAVDKITRNISYGSVSNIAYIGINYRF